MIKSWELVTLLASWKWYKAPTSAVHETLDFQSQVFHAQKVCHCHITGLFIAVGLQISIRSIQIVSRDLLFVCSQNNIWQQKTFAANYRWTQTGMCLKQAGSLKERLHLMKMSISTWLHLLDLYNCLKSQTLPERWICKSTFYINKLVGSWGRERTNKPRELLWQLDTYKCAQKRLPCNRG